MRGRSSSVYTWIFESDRGVLIPVLSATIIFLSYILTHKYPASVGGLFLLMGDTIRENGYALPRIIPQTEFGIPFAYPPIGPYSYAVLLDLGLNWKTLTIVYPAVLCIAISIPAYLLGKELLSRQHAVVFATATVSIPAIYFMHLNAGGGVRALAMFFMLFGLYTTAKSYNTESLAYTVFSGILFGFTLLTHFYNAVFFSIACITLFLFYERTLEGFKRGVIIALTGFSVSLPWFVQVVSNHGIEVFLRASGTKTGIGPDISTIAALLYIVPLHSALVNIIAASSIFGFIFLILNKRLFYIFWYIITSVIFVSWRLTVFLWTFPASIFIIEVFPKAFPEFDQEMVRFAVVVVLVTFATGSGALFAAGYPGGGIYFESEAGQSSLSDSHMEGIHWIDYHSDGDTTVLSEGLVTEWIPYLADVRIISATKGLEFSEERKTREYKQRYSQLGKCDSAECIISLIENGKLHPDYIVVNKPFYTDSLKSSDKLQIEFENDKMLIITFSGYRASTNEHRSNQKEFEMFSRRRYASVAD